MRCKRCLKTATHIHAKRDHAWNNGWKWQICPTCFKYSKKNRLILERDNDFSRDAKLYTTKIDN
jgi:hypothetical protein